MWNCMPIEFLLISLCAGHLSGPCSASLDQYKTLNPTFNEQMLLYQRTYTKDLPPEVFILGSAANFIYKKEIKVGIYKGWYVDMKEDQSLLGYKFSF